MASLCPAGCSFFMCHMCHCASICLLLTAQGDLGLSHRSSQNLQYFEVSKSSHILNHLNSVADSWQAVVPAGVWDQIWYFRTPSMGSSTSVRLHLAGPMGESPYMDLSMWASDEEAEMLAVKNKQFWLVWATPPSLTNSNLPFWWPSFSSFIGWCKISLCHININICKCLASHSPFRDQVNYNEFSEGIGKGFHCIITWNN